MAHFIIDRVKIKHFIMQNIIKWFFTEKIFYDIMLPMIKTYILRFMAKYRHYYKYKRLAIIVVSVWFAIIVTLGVISGFINRAKPIIISPEDENATAVDQIESNKRKIESGEMLSTKNNMSFFEIQQFNSKCSI